MSLQVEETVIDIAGTSMKMKRISTIPVPNEVTAVIPRAEIRRWRFHNGKLIEASETILNSITIADSPRFYPRSAGVSQRSSAMAKNSTVWRYPAGR